MSTGYVNTFFVFFQKRKHLAKTFWLDRLRTVPASGNHLPMCFTMKPIGRVRVAATKVPRHWSISELTGRLEISTEYESGLKDIAAGQHIEVLFVFHKSPPFTADHNIQYPPHHGRPRGVFSICSPVRPNPIGLSVLRVEAVRGTVIEVCGLDMIDGTPILDIKPHIPRKKTNAP
jgi:tRNA-Thr(GGU) m(6)t(6)A37 methyltransferase TsaA